MSTLFTLGEHLPPEKVAQLAAQARRESQPWLRLDAEVMRTSYNREPFLVSHRLAEHPRFTLPALFALCRRLDSAQVFCRAGKIPVDAEMDTSLGGYSQGTSPSTTPSAIPNTDQ